MNRYVNVSNWVYKNRLLYGKLLPQTVLRRSSSKDLLPKLDQILCPLSLSLLSSAEPEMIRRKKGEIFHHLIQVLIKHRHEKFFLQEPVLKPISSFIHEIYGPSRSPTHVEVKIPFTRFESKYGIKKNSFLDYLKDDKNRYKFHSVDFLLGYDVIGEIKTGSSDYLATGLLQISCYKVLLDFSFSPSFLRGESFREGHLLLPSKGELHQINFSEPEWFLFLREIIRPAMIKDNVAGLGTCLGLRIEQQDLRPLIKI